MTTNKNQLEPAEYKFRLTAKQDILSQLEAIIEFTRNHREGITNADPELVHEVAMKQIEWELAKIASQIHANLRGK